MSGNGGNDHSRKVSFTSLLAALCCIVLLAPIAQADAAKAEWHGVERVVAFADVHGAHAELVGLLREAGVIDARDRWTGGRAHVVSLGDLLDRGADSRRVMDLLMRLQAEDHAEPARHPGAGAGPARIQRLERRRKDGSASGGGPARRAPDAGPPRA